MRRVLLLSLALASACAVGVIADPPGGESSGTPTQLLDGGSDGGARVDAGASDAGALDGGQAAFVCPTAPPIDLADAAVRDLCTRPVFVAVGDAIRRIASYDGVSWVGDVWFDDGSSNQNEHANTGVAIGNGIIVVSGDGGLWRSIDGVTWQLVPSVPSTGFALHASKVGFFQGQFWVVGNGGTWTSRDGLAWTGWTGDTLLPGDAGAVGAFPGHGHGWAASADRLVFLNDSARYRVYDGRGWTDRILASPDGGPYQGWLDQIASGNGRFVVTGDACCGAGSPSADGLRSASTDLVAWPTVVTNETPGAVQIRFGGLVWDGRRFLSTGTRYGTTGHTSVDGLAWTPVDLGTGIGAFALGDDGTFVGTSAENLVRSTDGIHWTRTFTSDGGAPWSFDAIAAGRILKP